jgi:diguanylate cyclase (GGDEF)-like protein
MLKDLPDACCIFKVLTDPFGTVKDMMFLFANERYAQLVKKTSAELIGSTYYSVVTNRDEDWLKYSYQAAMLRQSTIVRTYNSDFDKWFEFWAVPVYQKGFCAFIIHDVTVAKKDEDDKILKRNSNNLVIGCAKELSSAEFGKGIKKVLKILGESIEADRVFIIETQDKEIKAMHEWINGTSSSTLPSKKDFENNDFITMWNSQLKGKDLVVINDTHEIQKVNDIVYKAVLAGRIQRYIVAKVRDKDDVIGYLVADNYANDLPLNVAEVIASAAIFISYEIRNRKLTSEMMYLGSHDALTGLGNRYALNQTLGLLAGMSVSVGVCYVDINGLKTVNDEKGHEAGDEMIKQAANAFGSVFKKKYCYRIGGDEFIAIIPEIEEEKFNELVKKMRNKKVDMAIGSVWSKNSGEINKAIQQADEAMYDDKTDYYENHERRHGKGKV